MNGLKSTRFTLLTLVLLISWGALASSRTIEPENVIPEQEKHTHWNAEKEEDCPLENQTEDGRCLTTAEGYYEEEDYDYEEEEDTEEEDYDEDSEEESSIIDEDKYTHVPLHILPQFEKPREDADYYLSEEESPLFLLPKSLEPGQMERVFWRRTGSPMQDEEAYVVGIPPQVLSETLKYLEETGIMEIIQDFLYGKQALDLEDHRVIQIKDGNNLAFRGSMWSGTNMLWIDPADERCYESFLSILRRSGFDIVMNALGRAFGLDGLQPDGVGLITNSYFNKKEDLGQVHTDLPWARGKFYNILIPIVIPKNGYQLYIGDGDDFGKVDMRHHVGLVAGAATYHGTGECDYRDTEEFRVALSVYVSDVNESNSQGIADDSTSIWPVTGDAEFSLAQAGRAWRKDGSSTMLTDKGRLPIERPDSREDCSEHMDRCISEPSTWREVCPRSCGLYVENDAYYKELAEIVAKDVEAFEKSFGMTPQQYQDTYSTMYPPAMEREEDDEYEDYEDEFEQDEYYEEDYEEKAEDGVSAGDEL